MKDTWEWEMELRMHGNKLHNKHQCIDTFPVGKKRKTGWTWRLESRVGKCWIDLIRKLVQLHALSYKMFSLFAFKYAVIVVLKSPLIRWDNNTLESKYKTCHDKTIAVLPTLTLFIHPRTTSTFEVILWKRKMFWSNSMWREYAPE